MAQAKAEDNDGVEVFHLNVGDPAVRASIYAAYDDLRQRGPASQAVLSAAGDIEAKAGGTLGRPVFVVTGYDEVAALVGDDRFSIDARSTMTPEQLAQMPPTPEEFLPLMQSLLSMDPPDHTRLRRLVQPSFTPRKIEALRPRIAAIANELVDAAERSADARGEVAPDRTMELIEALAHPLPLTVITEILGVSKEGGAAVHTWLETLAASAVDTEEYRITLIDLAAYLRELFAEKRARPTDDLITELVYAEEEGDRLNQQELLSMVFILVVAGHVTTVNLIANGVLAVLNHPDQLAQLRAEPGAVKNAVEEILRLSGSVEMAPPRYPREDVDFLGTHIPKGSTVLPVLAAADRDPGRFGCPAEFDISRSDANRHLAFSRGPHICLGAPLARVEGQVALSTLFARLRTLRLADPTMAGDAPLQPMLYRGVERLPLLF